MKTYLPKQLHHQRNLNILQIMESKMDLYNSFRSYTALALLLTLFSLVKQSTATNNITTPLQQSPAHLSWTSNNTRFDFIFNIEEPIKAPVELVSDSNYLNTNSLLKCINYSACLFKNGTFLESFDVNNTNLHNSLFNPVPSDSSNQTLPKTDCDNANRFKIVHYCNTHWNPPAYLHRHDCSHKIEWHSPLRCHPDSVNHEHPCYVYDHKGKLIDLTPWILSDGSSYNISLGKINSGLIREFHLNVCNEAHHACGPNVSACYVDTKVGPIESGYNNLTSIKYSKNGTVLLTSLGQYRKECEGDRIKTVIQFTCKNGSSQSGPTLISSTNCENIIEWSSLAACPTSDVAVTANECKIKYEPLGVDIDIRRLTNNKTMVEVKNMKIGGQFKKMMLGICGGLPRGLLCEGKNISTTQACLMGATNESSSVNDSQIVGSTLKSSIRLADDRLYLESFSINKTCSEVIRRGFNVTQKVGTRLEFFCSSESGEVPTFLGYDDCTYVFEWGTPLMCSRAFETPSRVIVKLSEVKGGADKILGNHGTDFKNVNLKDVLKSESRKNELSIHDKEPINMNDKIHVSQSSKMNSAHKYFMIALIMMSFVAFIALIFILDRKTRLRITLRQAGRVFRSNQQPYSRVVNDLDL